MTEVQAHGKTREEINYESINEMLLERFHFDAEEPKQVIETVTKEFSALCPFSGLPDYGTVIIRYIPDLLCVELRSLKYYLLSFRNVGIYQEAVTERIYKDLLCLLHTTKLQVITKYNNRGGFHTECKKGMLP